MNPAKKLIAFILSVSMFVSLCPSFNVTFTAETTEETTESTEAPAEVQRDFESEYGSIVSKEYYPQTDIPSAVISSTEPVTVYDDVLNGTSYGVTSENLTGLQIWLEQCIVYENGNIIYRYSLVDKEHEFQNTALTYQFIPAEYITPALNLGTDDGFTVSEEGSIVEDTGIRLDFVVENESPEGVDIGYPTATITSTNLNIYANQTYGSLGVNVGDASGEVIELLLSFTYSNGEVIYQFAYRGTTNAALKEAAVDYYFISAKDIVINGVEEQPKDAETIYSELILITDWRGWEDYFSNLSEEERNSIYSLPEDKIAELERLDAYFYKQKQEEFAPPAVDYVEVAPLVIRTMVGSTEITVDGTLPVDSLLSAYALDTASMDTSNYDIKDNSNIISAYDISISTQQTSNWQPEEGNTLAVSIDAASMGIPDGTNVVVHHDHEGEISKYFATVTDGKIVVDVDGFSDFLLELNPTEINKLGSFISVDSIPLYYNFYSSDEVYNLSSANFPENFVVEYSFTYGNDTWYLINTETWLTVAENEVYPPYVNASYVNLSVTDTLRDPETHVAVSGGIPEGAVLSVEPAAIDNTGLDVSQYPFGSNSILYDVKLLDESNVEIQPTGDITVYFPVSSVPFIYGTKYFSFNIHNGFFDILGLSAYLGGSLEFELNKLSYIGAVELQATESLGDLLITTEGVTATETENIYFTEDEEISAVINKTPVTVYENSLEATAVGVVVENTLNVKKYTIR